MPASEVQETAAREVRLRTRNLLLAAAFSRALATGLIGVLLGIYLAQLKLDPRQIGAVISFALAGGALAALLVTVFGSRFRPRPMLVTLCALATLGGTAAIFTDSFQLLAAAGFAGMFNAMGRDRGALPIIEQALLPAMAGETSRTSVFAWYNALLDAGYACGGLLAGLPTLLQAAGFGAVDAFKVTLAVYAALYALSTVLYALLPPVADAVKSVSLRALPADSRRIVWKISFLFFIDAFGGGFLGSALLSYFFFERFAASEAIIAVLFFVGRGLSAASHLAAAWLAKRIGLIRTMVFTHVPSSLLLITVGLTPDFGVAALLFLLREALNEMDVPTRQSYVMAVVRPEERLAAAGITSLVRVAGWAAAPAIAGVLMSTGGLAAPLFVGAALKISYDILLWRDFSKVKAPEER